MGAVQETVTYSSTWAVISSRAAGQFLSTTLTVLTLGTVA